MARNIQGQATDIDSVVKQLFELVDGRNSGNNQQEQPNEKVEHKVRSQHQGSNVIAFKPKSEAKSKPASGSSFKKAVGAEDAPDWDDPGFEEV